MVGLPIVIDGGELILNGTSMHTLAWGVYDVKPLLLGHPVLRTADDPVIPGLDGRLGFDDEEDETTVSLPMWLTGECDPNGEQFTNTIVGLRRNRDALRASVPQGQIITGQVDLHDDDETVLEDLVKVQFELVDITALEVPMMLHITIPHGTFGAALEDGS